MRASRGFVLIVVLALAIGSMSPAGASVGAQQKCSGPPPTTQSGRTSLSPGLNGAKNAQEISVTVSLFSCSPARTTRGSGTLKTTIKVKAPQTCELLQNPHTLKGTAVITWKDEYTSTIPMTFTLSGASHYVTVTGTVSKGLFKNHPVGGQLHYAEVVSPHGLQEQDPGEPLRADLDRHAHLRDDEGVRRSLIRARRGRPGAFTR
jgi:hypothetical protein